MIKLKDTLGEEWSDKYKRSIDCNNPKGFSQRAHCQSKEKKESVNENSISDLEKKLKSHDWWYAYSDDSRRYNSGDNNWREITKMIKGLKGDKEAEKLWNKYAPKDFGYSFKKLSENTITEDVSYGYKHILHLIPTGYSPNNPKYKKDLTDLRDLLNKFYDTHGYDVRIRNTF